ncbi:MAG: protein TolQ [Porticoccus sp.]|jgi:biopolymer transport protein TolQ|tara:strand:+ start:263 stop:937 length:675 start_codon:yes stop_codon:yes gene_type:complete
MTEQLSLWSLIFNASFLVQFVMLILFLASVVSWVMIIQRGLYLREAEYNSRQFENDFWSGIDLNKLYEDIRISDAGEGLPEVFRAGFREFSKLSHQAGVEPEAVMEGTERSMRVALAREEEALNQNLPFLASVASVSPYIGLFGTVWGIMNSFRGLANVQQATLAVVAPGISEALIATAMGLFAAIPAVLAYNRYSSAAETIYNSYETFAEELSTILHRRIHSK